jgi:hypothetical protein
MATVNEPLLRLSDPNVFPLPPAFSGGTYETEAQYRARVADTLLDTALPNYVTAAADGQTLRSGRLVAATDTYDRNVLANGGLVSLVVFDATGTDPGPLATTGVPAGYVSQIYVSLANVYVVENSTAHGQPVSDIYQFAIGAQAGVKLQAIGEVPGSIVNQFSLDEYNGYLRVATQTGYGNQATSNVYVLQDQGLELQIVGRLEGLTPGENMFSSLFMANTGYVVTFGPQQPVIDPGTGAYRINPPNWVDPLLVIDLSDPTHPQLRGQLSIPGFSNYLQLVDEHYLVGFGRDANTTDGTWGKPQVSLFDVSDLDHPALLSRITIDTGPNVQSDAFNDHHAVSYFAAQHILAIPLNTTNLETISNGLSTQQEYRTRSQLLVFKIDPTAGHGAVQSVGAVALHTPLSRSVRIENELYAIGTDTIQASVLTDPGTQLGEVYFGPLAFDSSFAVDKSAVNQRLNVLNGFSLPDFVHDALRIASVSVPTAGGTVSIAPDGLSVLYTPPADFAQRADSFQYTVTDSTGRSETATAWLTISWTSFQQRMHDLAVARLAATLGVSPAQIQDQPDDWGAYQGGPSEHIWQDTNLETGQPGQPISTPGYEFRLYYRNNEFTYHTDLTSRVILASDRLYTLPDDYTLVENSVGNVLQVTANDYAGVTSYRTPMITAVTAGDHGATVRISDDGQSLIYTPAAGFVGVDQLTYTLADGARAIVKITIPWDRLADRMVQLAEQDLAGVLGVSLGQIGFTSATRRVMSDNSLAVELNGVPFKNAWTIGFEIHLNYRGVDVEYDTDTAQAVKLVYAPGLIRPDTFAVNEQSVNNRLDVEGNDFPGTGYASLPTIASVTGGTAGGQVSISADGRTAVYTPPAGFTGDDTFTYTIGDLTTSVKVTVSQADALARFHMEVADAYGDATSSFQVGDLIRVKVFGTDLRGGQAGISAASFQLLFDPSLASVEGNIAYGAGPTSTTGPQIQPGQVQLNLQAGKAVTDGDPLLATITLRANKSGPFQFTVHGTGDGIDLVGAGGQAIAAYPADAVSTVTQVVCPLQNPQPDLTADVNHDGLVSARDLLFVIDDLAIHGAHAIVPTSAAELAAARLGFGVHFAQPNYCDVDGNGIVTAGDLLRILDFLNCSTPVGRAANAAVVPAVGVSSGSAARAGTANASAASAAPSATGSTTFPAAQASPAATDMVFALIPIVSPAGGAQSVGQLGLVNGTQPSAHDAAIVDLAGNASAHEIDLPLSNWLSSQPADSASTADRDALSSLPASETVDSLFA